MKSTTCKNCDFTFEGKFCPQCGQKGSTKRFKTKDLFQDLLKKEFHWDKGVLLTTRHLMTQPGPTIRGYLAGKRINYTKPLTYLFLVVTASLLVYTKEDIFDNNSPFALKRKGDPALQNAFLEWVFGHMAIVILGMIPFLALVSKWMYKKAKLHYAEHFVLNTYAMAGMTLLGLFVSGIAKTFGYKVQSLETMPLSTSLSLLYFAWIYVDVFNARKRWYGGLKAVSVCILGYMLYILFAMTIGVAGVLLYLLLLKPML